MDRKPEVIIIAGMPASGKSTAALKLGRIFGYPILEKDALKEALFDTIGFECYAEKRRLDTAAAAVLLKAADSMLQSGTSLILVNNFRTDMQEAVQKMLDDHNCSCVTVFFAGDADVFYKRYVERDLAHARHLGHIVQDHFPPHPGDNTDYAMTRAEFAEKFEKLGMADFRINGKRIEIDATHPEAIDVSALAAEIKQAFCEMNEKELL